MASEGTRWDVKLRGCGVVKTTASNQMAGKRGHWSKGEGCGASGANPFKSTKVGAPCSWSAGNRRAGRRLLRQSSSKWGAGLPAEGLGSHGRCLGGGVIDRT